MSKEMKYEAVHAAKTGIYLARLRRQAGYTQVEAAQKLHVSNKAVSKWESGKGLPEIGILPAIAALYGVTVDEILAGESLAESEGETCRAQMRQAEDKSKRTEALAGWQSFRSRKRFFFSYLAVWVIAALGPVLFWLLPSVWDADQTRIGIIIWAAVLFLAAGICLGLQYFDIREIARLGKDGNPEGSHPEDSHPGGMDASGRLLLWNRGMAVVLPLLLSGLALLVLSHTEDYLMPAALPAPYVNNLPDSFPEMYLQYLGLPTGTFQTSFNISFNAATYLYACLPVLLSGSLLWAMVSLAGKAWLERKDRSLLRLRFLQIAAAAAAAVFFAGLSGWLGGRYESSHAIEAEVFEDDSAYEAFVGDYMEVYEGFRAYAVLDGEEWPDVSGGQTVIDCRYLDDRLGREERYAAYRRVIGLDTENRTVWRAAPLEERMENRLMRISATGIAGGVCLAGVLVCGCVRRRKRGEE